MHLGAINIVTVRSTLTRFLSQHFTDVKDGSTFQAISILDLIPVLPPDARKSIVDYMKFVLKK